MTQINIAIAGLGIVGSGVFEILTKQIDLLNKRSKNQVNLVAASSRTAKDFIDQSKIKFYQNPLDLADDPEINIIIEAIGGADGIALELCKKTLKNKKHFITANKAMIATHGLELAKLAEENNVALAFEAAVAGGIPCLKTIKEGLIGNQISKIYAILNGTCNYILSKMEGEKISFAEALGQAQNLGYAEADPTFDIEGIDSAHKIAILASIAKNSAVKLDKMNIEGITKISLFDIQTADEFGYKIKLLGIFEDLKDNNIKQSIYPALISKKHNIANVEDSFNAVLSFGNNCDWNLQVGRGAGSKPTACAIVADIMDIANDRFFAAFGTNTKNLIEINITDLGQQKSCYYLRFVAEKDFATQNNLISNVFGENSIIEQSNIEEINEDQIIYGLITSQIKEEDFLLFIKKAQSINQINDINWIRITEI
jgi:homoserine dehydrogenase